MQLPLMTSCNETSGAMGRWKPARQLSIGFALGWWFMAQISPCHKSSLEPCNSRIHPGAHRQMFPELAGQTRCRSGQQHQPQPLVPAFFSGGSQEGGNLMKRQERRLGSRWPWSRMVVVVAVSSTHVVPLWGQWSCVTRRCYTPWLGRLHAHAPATALKVPAGVSGGSSLLSGGSAGLFCVRVQAEKLYGRSEEQPPHSGPRPQSPLHGRWGGGWFRGSDPEYSRELLPLATRGRRGRCGSRVCTFPGR